MIDLEIDLKLNLCAVDEPLSSDNNLNFKVFHSVLD